MQINQQPKSKEEVQALCEEYEKLFVMTAWKDLIQDITLNNNMLFPALMSNQATEADLNKAKGRHDVYMYLIGLEDMIRHVKEGINLEADDV